MQVEIVIYSVDLGDVCVVVNLDGWLFELMLYLGVMIGYVYGELVD